MSKPKHERTLAETEAQAVARNIRVSPRKLNLVAGLIRGRSAQDAVATLTFSKRRIAQTVKKTLESAIAEWKRLPAALLFASGYAANTGAIPALVGRGDVVYSDALNHASLIDGARLSRAQVRVFPHLDLDALERMLREDAGTPISA